MGLQKVVFSKAKKHPLTYSVVSVCGNSRTLMFHGSSYIQEATGFISGDLYDVYFDRLSAVMQIQRVTVKSRNTHTIRRMAPKSRIITGLCFSFSGWPFEGFFPEASQAPLQVLKAEAGVLLFRVPVDVKKGK